MSKLSNRQWLQVQKLKSKTYRSTKGSNRVYCPQAKKSKYLYESEQKARLAVEFNKEIGNTRYYVCDGCMGFHTTSQPLKVNR